MTRKGKIARLPRQIRDALNLRLEDNQTGPALLDWLNSLPDVQAVLAREFDGHPITKQNLSEWRTGGFAEWQSRQEALADARELAADAEELTAATAGKLTDHLATVLTARYATALAAWNGELTEEFRRKLGTLRALCQDVVELRRGDHSGARLKIEQERLDREREKTEEEVVAQFERWSQNPALRDWILENTLSAAQKARRIREIFGLASAGDPPATQPGSPLVQPSPTKSNQVQPPEAAPAPGPPPARTSEGPATSQG